MDKYEYLLHTWGGFYNEEYITVHKEKPGYFFFDTKEELNSYLKKLQYIERVMKATRLMYVIEEGYKVRYKTIAKMDFIYKNKIYKHKEDFGYAYSPDTARFMFELGNYSCDCNRSNFIRRNYGLVIPKLECGDQIEMENLEIIQIKITDYGICLL